MAKELTEKNAFYVLRVTVLADPAPTGLKTGESYLMLALIDNYDRKTRLKQNQIRYRERVPIPTSGINLGGTLQKVVFGTNPAPAVTFDGVALPAAGTNPLGNQATIRYIYDAGIAKTAVTGTLVGFGKVQVQGWQYDYNLSVWCVEAKKQMLYFKAGDVQVDCLYIMTHGGPPSDT